MTTSFEEFERLLTRLIGQDKRPVLVYSGIFAIARGFACSRSELAPKLLQSIQKVVGSQRTLLMPSYTQGFCDGEINLDHEPGVTGMVNECLREQSTTIRTASAFFSFVAQGPQAQELEALRPQYAWGERSLFEWVEKQNAHVVMVGVPWQMCSFLHRIEWLAQVPYRYNKEFSGTVIYKGQKSFLTETLFVRSLDPVAENVWPCIDDLLHGCGMMSFPLGPSQVAAIDAEYLVQGLLPVIEANPYSFVKNAEELKKKYG